MADPLAACLAELERHSPRVAEAVVASGPGDYAWTTTPAGAVVLEHGGRPLDSRRDPAGAAARQAAACPAPAVVLAGFGSGYLAEALLARGAKLTVVVGDPAELAAALRGRDLTAVCRAARFHLARHVADPHGAAALKAAAPDLIAHGPSVSRSADLQWLVERWPRIAVAPRRPRIVVVGPLAGGTLEMARASARAFAALGADVRDIDPAAMAAGLDWLSALARDAPAAARWQDRLIDLIADLVVEIATSWQADLVFALAQAPLGRRHVERLAEASVPAAFWFAENHRVLPYWAHVAPAYRWVYGIQPGAFEARLASLGVAHPGYLPAACDPAVHGPVCLTAEERDRYAAPISFAGAPYVNRRKVFARLADLPLRLWGPDWDRDPVLRAKVAGAHRFTTGEMVRIFAASTINLNLHAASHVDGLDPQPDFVNPRTFELAACGAFQLTDWRRPLGDLFAADEIATFRTVGELRALIERYLDDAPGRARMAERARRRALATHTYVHRMDRVLRDTIAPDLYGACARPRPPSLDQAIDGLARSDQISRDELVLRAVRALASGGRVA